MAGSSQAPQFEDDYGPESPYAIERPLARAPAVQTTSSLVPEYSLARQEVSHSLNGSAAPPQAAAPAGQTTLMGEGGCDPMEIQPDAAAGGNETTVIGPQHFRIGPKKHAYNYTRQDGLVYGQLSSVRMQPRPRHFAAPFVSVSQLAGRVMVRCERGKPRPYGAGHCSEWDPGLSFS